MPLLAIVLLLGYGFASKQYTGFGADSIQLLPADSTENCCDGATARYDQIDSVEFYRALVPAEEEEALPTRQALENLRGRKKG